jgi:transcription elongation GreA/GreB family factor
VSRAFVKETEGDTVGFPNRSISPHPNLVAEAGLAGIVSALDRFEAAHRSAAAKDDREATAIALREVRYWRTRASAEVVKPSEDKRKACFGMTVTVRSDDGRGQSFEIVGEDEADPSHGTVSYLSPLAQAELTRGVADAVTTANSQAVLLDVG